MEVADKRGSGSISARRSLRAYKKSAQYRDLLKSLVARKEERGMSDREKCRLRLERTLAQFELDKLRDGRALSEYTGVMQMNDPMRGLVETGVEDD